MKTPPKLVGTKTQNWANLKYKIASQVFFPCIINFHKTGTVHLGRNPFSSYFNQVSNLISMSNVKSNFEKFAILTLDVGREAKTSLGLKRIKFERSLLLSFHVKSWLISIPLLLYYNHWKLQDFTFNLLKKFDGLNDLQSTRITENISTTKCWLPTSVSSGFLYGASNRSSTSNSSAILEWSNLPLKYDENYN